MLVLKPGCSVRKVGLQRTPEQALLGGFHGCLLLSAIGINELLKLGQAEETINSSPELYSSLLTPAKDAGIVWGTRSLFLSIAENLSPEDAEKVAPHVRRNKYGDIVE